MVQEKPAGSAGSGQGKTGADAPAFRYRKSPCHHKYLRISFSYIQEHLVICYHVHYFVIVLLLAGDRGLIGSGARVRSGGAHYLRFHRVRSSRNFQISEGTCRIPGGCHHLHGARAFLRMHRFFHRYNPFVRAQLVHRCLFCFFVLALCLPLCTVSRTIITHMRIII